MHISIISGSTRIDRKSHRVALGLEKAFQQRGSHSVEVLDLAAYNFPIIEEVLQRHPNPPAGLADFAEKIRASDAFVFVSPEYNGTYTSALKNAVDYLKDQEFARKVVGVSSVSTGMMGGIRAAMEMQHLVLGVGGFPIPQMFNVPQVHLKFDEAGNLTDPNFEKNLNTFLDRFLWLAEAVFAKKQP
ncbi:MAG: NADPH-dependent FMN reductase [Saprospiraceae bacterium]